MTSACIVLAGWFGAIGLAVAAEPVVPMSPQHTAPMAAPVSDAIDAVAIDGIGTPLAVDALEQLRGGDDNVSNNIDVHGEVDGNSAEDVLTGNNSIGGGSFTDANGITTVIQNSGNNVLIQNAMVVTVQFVDPSP